MVTLSVHLVVRLLADDDLEAEHSARPADVTVAGDSVMEDAFAPSADRLVVLDELEHLLFICGHDDAVVDEDAEAIAVMPRWADRWHDRRRLERVVWRVSRRLHRWEWTVILIPLHDGCSSGPVGVEHPLHERDSAFGHVPLDGHLD